jgi:ParB family chromosome partitioning protein
MSDESATIEMLDSNLHRRRIRYSEKASAYKLQNEIWVKMRERKELRTADKGKKTIEILADQTEHSYKNIQRFIKLTELHPKLLEMLDRGEISFTPAVQLAYLTLEEQELFIEAMGFSQCAPSLSQAQRMKELSKRGLLTLEKMQDIMSEVKKGEVKRVTFKNEQLHRYFPEHYTADMMKREIIGILSVWKKEQLQK